MNRNTCHFGTARAFTASVLGLFAWSNAIASTGLLDDLSRAYCSTGRGILLIGMMEFNDLGLRELRRCDLGKLHHQHGTGREVRSVEQASAISSARSKLLQGILTHARGTDYTIDASRKCDR